VHDDASGSWLLAAGTIVALEGDNHPISSLKRLLFDFLARGFKAMDKFDGHFALIIYDGREDTLSVFSDPMGLFSIFYYQDGKKLYVSSSAIAIAKQVAAQPDLIGIEYFLQGGRMDAGKTFWQDLKRMQAGTMLQVKQAELQEHVYWMPTIDASITRLPMDDALTQYDQILTNTFSRLFDREGKIWADLTGGFDTRLVMTYVAKRQQPYITYCMAPKGHPDVQLSQQISSALHWEFVHSQLPDAWGEDQFQEWKIAADCGDGWANVLRFAITRRGIKARNHALKARAVGIGGENLRGYYWLIEKARIGKTPDVHYDALIDHLIPTGLPAHILRRDRTREVREDLLNFIKTLCAQYAQYPNTVKLDRVEMYRDAGHGGAYVSATAELQRSLAPLCFKQAADFAFSLNYRWKYPRHHVFLRTLLARENQELASFATTTGGPALPMCATNLHQFWPLWQALAKRAIAVGSKKLIGKAVQIGSPANPAGYPLPAWRKAFHAYARSEGMLTYEKMHTRGLYDRDAFNAYIQQSEGDSGGSEFIDHVISVEMTMRAAGTIVS
jgi:hypothetical protein